MVREDLVSGAVSFLQDPSVSNAPLENRIAFLKSKNLTQEEIDVALQRVGSEPIAPSGQAQSAQPYPYQPQQYRQTQGYGAYPGNYWQPPPPPEVPRRDWRDWFIMATVVGGVGYGAYTLAKRYIYPVIAPPTPPQLEQDKAAIDASFEKAFALLDQLSTDTEELKASERARTERLDVALSEVEAVLSNMKDATKRRDDEVRRTNEEVGSLRDLIPKALQAQERSADERLKELAREMQSLKTLISNRVNPAATGRPQVPTLYDGQPNNASALSPAAAAAPAALTTSSTGTAINGASPGANDDQSSLSAAQTPAESTSTSPYSARTNGRAKIPAWQLAASKQKEASQQDTTQSGTAVDASSS